jgi:hypothetical protein
MHYLVCAKPTNSPQPLKSLPAFGKKVLKLKEKSRLSSGESIACLQAGLKVEVFKQTTHRVT